MTDHTDIKHSKRGVTILAFGTHHKTGTKWIRGALSKISKKSGIKMHYNPSASDSWMENIKDRPALIFSGSSRFPEALRNDSKTHIIRMIRDPRDMLISAMKYHCKSTDRHEKFLYYPRPELGDLSYQEHLNNINSYEDKLLFELENHHAQTMKKLLSAKLDSKFITHWKYEDLIADYECNHFREVFETLDVDDRTVDKAVRIFYRNSLFGGQKGGAANDGIHVSSGQPNQWRSKLPRNVAKRYRDIFGASLIELGYEVDLDWPDKIQN